MCLCTEEVTGETACQGQAAAASYSLQQFWGGQQQDAMGEKWLSGHAAAAVRQSHRTGQDQVGSGLC